jgi:DNA-binding MarR family transcriptional regulator
MISCPHCGGALPRTSRFVAGLTRKQAIVLDFLAGELLAGRLSPTLREIGAAVQTSPGRVCQLLADLDQRGYVARIPGHARSVTMTEKGWALYRPMEASDAA